MQDDWRRWLRQRLRRLRRPAFLGALRRTKPLSDKWGFDRGRPVDRYYIESFIAAHRADIRGRVLEVQAPLYTERFGTSVGRTDIVDVVADNPLATIVADLQSPSAIESDSFDCFLLTQTLQLLYEYRAAIRHAHRILRPGGVLLVTVPAASRTTGDAMPDFWRFTPAACARIFGEVFGDSNVQVTGYGNVLACVGFLMGMADDELRRTELDVRDPRFPLVVGVRAVKEGNQEAG